MAEEKSSSGLERLETGSDLPGTPTTRAPPLPESVTDVQGSEEQRAAAYTQRLEEILGHLGAFGDIGYSETIDSHAYETLRGLSAGALLPIGELLSHGAAVRTQLLYFTAERAEFQRDQRKVQEQLRAITAQRDILVTQQRNDRAAAAFLRAQDGAPGAGGGVQQTPLRFGSAFSPGSGLSLATSAVPPAAVMIQGYTKSLSVPITSSMAKAFKAFVMHEHAARRTVDREPLIALDARLVLSVRFRVLSVHKGFAPEFPDGAKTDAEIARLDELVLHPERWWMLWDDDTFVTRLVAA
ncbi:hypothetical protein B484DRAFT_465626, partial [Ochromonadaceae sp. CCMP2298]